METFCMCRVWPIELSDSKWNAKINNKCYYYFIQFVEWTRFQTNRRKKTMNNYIKNIMCNIFKKLNGIDHECHRYACRVNFSLIIFFFEKKNNWKKNHFQLSVLNWRAFDRLVESYLNDIIFFYLYESAFADINILETHFNWGFEMNFIEKSRNFFFRASGKNDREKKNIRDPQPPNEPY